MVEEPYLGFGQYQMVSLRMLDIVVAMYRTERAVMGKRESEVLTMYFNRNFTKFLVDKEGNVVGRYGPSKTPKELAPEIEKVL